MTDRAAAPNPADDSAAARLVGALFEQFPRSTQVLAPDGTTVAVNLAWQRLWGATLADVRDYDLLADRQLEESGVAALIRRAFAGETVSLPPLAYVPPRGDLAGQDVWVRATAAPLSDPDGIVTHVVLVHEDVSPDVMTARRLERLRAMLAEAQEMARVGTWEWDLASGDLAWTDQLYRIFGLDPANGISYERFLARLPAGDARRLEAAIARALRTGEPFDLDHRIVLPSGEERTIHARGRVESGPAGQPERMIGSGQDVTERRAREDRQRFLAEVGEALATSLDLDAALDRVARLAVPVLCDWCVIDLLEPDGSLRRAAAAHRDPAREGALAELARRYPTIRPGQPHTIRDVITDGAARVDARVSPERLAAQARDAAHLALLRDLGFAAEIVAPLVARGRTLGAITFVLAEEARRYGPDEADLAIDLARRAALALDNARLYAEARAGDEQLRAAFDGASAGMALVGLDGRFLRVNRALRDMLGYADDELLRLTSHAVTHPDDREAGHARFARLISGEVEAYQAEKRYLRKDGGVVWGLLSAAVVHDADGAPFHLVSQIQDITERKVAEAERERLAAIVESAHDAIIGRDLDGTITSWNRGAEQMFGYSRAEMLGRSIAFLAPPEAADEIGDFLDAIRRGDRVEGYETVRMTRDGRAIHVALSTSPVRDAAGQIVGASTIARDISERIRLDELRRDFLAMVTHDLRTPLTAILGNAQLLERRGEYRAAAVADIAAQADRMRRLIDDLADVVRVEAGRLMLRRAPVDLVELARQEAASIQRHSGIHAVAIEAPNGPVVGEWDADRLGQVLANLLGNAVKYAPDGGEIAVRVARDGGFAAISVRDEGPGIDPEHLPRLFDRFYRAQSQGAGGLGLGLYIARMIVEAHGGTIHAASEPGRGSTFTVRLPAGA